MKQHRWLGAIVAASWLSACAAGPGFGERDRFVITTPQYYDNRVFFMSPVATDGNWPLLNSQQAKVEPTDPSRINHGSALSIILNSVSLPPSRDAEGEPVTVGPRDIAVVIDVATKTNGTEESIVAWYQRGVQPDQALNFSNLLLYFDPRWDARVAPLIRIRVVDVTSEKNAEVREALGQVKQFMSSVGPVLSSSTSAVLSVATRAAGLIVTRPNKQLLDYTVQFYSQEQMYESYGSDLTPLKKGRVLLIGRPPRTTSAYWRGFDGYYDGAALQVYRDSAPVESPVVLLTISTAQSVVPTIVTARSTYLQKLLNDGQQADIESVKTAGRSVWDGVRTYTLLEELRRSRDIASLQNVYGAYGDTSDAAKLSDDDKALLRETFRQISICTTLTTDANIDAWWNQNVDSFAFEKGSFKLKDEKCP